MSAELQECVDPHTLSVRRVNLPDLSEKGQWLVDRLKEKFTDYQDSALMGWLRSLTTEDNSRHFVRTDRAFALSEIRMEKMTTQPTIIDRFVLIEEGADVSEGQALYLDMARWAGNLGASEIAINNKSDVPRDFIEEVLGKVIERKQLYHKLK